MFDPNRRGSGFAAGQQSVYVTMRDGTRIAVEIWLPESVARGETVGTVAWFTRYWRARVNTERAEKPTQRTMNQMLNAAGYAFATIDVRGSGASFGFRAVEYPDDEVTDIGEVIQWLAGQPWSNGRVATDGISYVGNTAELAAATGAPALKAAVPRFTDFDFYSQILFPGGLQNIRFLTEWGIYVKALDTNDIETLRTEFNMGYQNCLGVKPVDGDHDQSLLKAAIEEHKNNTYYTESYSDWLYRDDIMGRVGGEQSIRRRALYEYREAFEKSRVPMMHWAGWLDSGVAEGAIARFSTFDSPNLVFIGPWNHGAISNANPYSGPDIPVSPSADEQFKQIVAFLEPYLTENVDAGQAKREIHYFTMGEDRWQVSQEWPPQTVAQERWFLCADSRLSRQSPAESAGMDRYKVDFEAGTGSLTRWATSMGGTPVDYGDRARADQRLLTYTSSPLLQDIELTGHPVVNLQVSSTHDDGAFIVYLEDVWPDGRVTYITEGILRAIHRKTSNAPAPYRMFGPYRTYLRRDALPLVPGTVTALAFSLFPTSVLIRRGHAIRIAIAGHDKNNFIRVPASGNPTVSIHRNSTHTSYIELPIIRRKT